MTYLGIVFVADDEPELREATTRVLEHTGYLVLPARDGLEALARMHGISGRALAIIDLSMPKMNGVELIRRMRADARLSYIPILVITSSEVATVDGADLLLHKPFLPSTLLDAVRALFDANASSASSRS